MTRVKTRLRQVQECRREKAATLDESAFYRRFKDTGNLDLCVFSNEPCVAPFTPSDF